MTAKKSAARTTEAAKPGKAKTSARKALGAAKAPAEKTAAQVKATAKAAKKPEAPKAAPKAAKSAKKADAPKPAPKKSEAAKTAAAKPAAPKNAVSDAALKKPAAAARAKGAPKAKFDPDRRREMIAAAAARRRKSVTARPPAPPIAVIRPREASPVERHRFSIGDEVRVISTSGMWFKHGIDYRVTAALPPQGGKLQYRIKNEQEPYERVVSESQLAAASEQAPFQLI